MKPTALITGATKGIGRSIVETLATQYDIVGIARFPDSTFPGKLFTADLENEIETNEILNRITAEYKISILINNVGFNHLESLGNIAQESYEKILHLNVKTCLDVTQHILPGMKQLGNGRIINMGARALLGRKNSSVYAAAKSAIVGFTRSWALELAPFGITVNCVSPGPIETEMLAKNVPIGSDYREQVINSIPLKRIGTVEEVSSLVNYLTSPQAGFITGQNIYVCGGSSIAFQEF